MVNIPEELYPYIHIMFRAYVNVALLNEDMPHIFSDDINNTFTRNILYNIEINAAKTILMTEDIEAPAIGNLIRQAMFKQYAMKVIYNYNAFTNLLKSWGFFDQ